MADDDKNKERRSSSRIPVELEVDYSTYSTYHLRRITNISKGGAFIKTQNPLPVGTELAIKFFLPDHTDPIASQVRVCWTYKQPAHVTMNSSGMGVEFLQIDQEDLEKIQTFIDEKGS